MLLILTYKLIRWFNQRESGKEVSLSWNSKSYHRSLLQRKKPKKPKRMVTWVARKLSSILLIKVILNQRNKYLPQVKTKRILIRKAMKDWITQGEVSKLFLIGNKNKNKLNHNQRIALDKVIQFRSRKRKVKFWLNKLRLNQV